MTTMTEGPKCLLVSSVLCPPSSGSQTGARRCALRRSGLAVVGPDLAFAQRSRTPAHQPAGIGGAAVFDAIRNRILRLRLPGLLPRRPSLLLRGWAPLGRRLGGIVQ